MSFEVSEPLKTAVRPEEISRPDKPLFPDGTTKLDLARYHEAIAPVLVPHVKDRPLNLQRFPDGIEGRGLFTQQAPNHFPDHIRRITVRKEGGTVDHASVSSADDLVYLAGQAAITLHMWMSRRDKLGDSETGRRFGVQEESHCGGRRVQKEDYRW